MAKTKHTPEFWGKYVHEVRDVLIASVMSQKNAVLLSAPGWGKTRIAKRLSEEIAAEYGSFFIRLEGSTPPQVVKGMVDPAKALQDPPEFILKQEDTPYDKRAQIVVLDEIFRPSDPVFDSLVDVLDRHDVNPDDAPVVWGTSNFVVKNQRTNAVIDRVALWLWVTPQTMEVEDFIQHIAYRKRGTDLAVPTNGVPLPTWEDVIKVRSYEPSEKTVKVITSLLSTLAAESAVAGFDVNPRRLTHWYDLVYRYTAWLEGSADFELVPAQAATVLRYAFPTLTEEDWRKWDQVARSVGDPILAALDSATNQAYDAFKDIMKTGMSPSESAAELGKILAQVQSTMKHLEKTHGKDPRIAERVTAISNTYAQILNGQDPFGVDME
ncbi:MAG: AAA family ATPase [Planctomycetota bacterium]|jgi:hypothetical protein